MSNSGGFEEISLSGYNGGDLVFRGRQFSEGSFFEDGVLTRLRLFLMEDNRLVYYVVSSNDGLKDRRVYILKVEGDICHIDNGRQSISMSMDMLFSAVYGLCGMESSQEEELRATLEEGLRAVAL